MDGPLSARAFLAFRQAIGGRSCIQPRGAATDRGPWRRAQIEFQSLRRAMTRDDVSECFDPGFQTICHHTLIALSDWMSTSAAAVAPQSGSSRRACAVAVIFSLGQHGPDDPSGFGGERHHGDLVGPTCEQLAQPGIADAVPLLLAQMGAGAVDQQRTQGAVSLLGEAAGTMLAAGAVVASGQAHPGSKVTAGE